MFNNRQFPFVIMGADNLPRLQLEQAHEHRSFFYFLTTAQHVLDHRHSSLENRLKLSEQIIKNRSIWRPNSSSSASSFKTQLPFLDFVEGAAIFFSGANNTYLINSWVDANISTLAIYNPWVSDLIFIFSGLFT
jgi:hypothetical protein